MTLGIIPARGGSKGIRRKNVRVIAGKPLIAWTIEAARQARGIDLVVVSTEDTEIAQTAVSWGAQMLRRPQHLATDEASTLDVLIHVLHEIPADTVVLLQPTSPIRRPGLIDECIVEFRQGDYDSLATGLVCTMTEYGKNTLRRQDIQGFFYDDGNVYVMKGDMVRGGDRYGQKIGRKIVSPWENMEIDAEHEFWLCEKVLESKIYLDSGE